MYKCGNYCDTITNPCKIRIIHKATETQKFSYDLRKNKTRPFSKKSEDTEPNKYQPIFITPALAKAFQRQKQHQTPDFLERRKI